MSANGDDVKMDDKAANDGLRDYRTSIEQTLRLVVERPHSNCALSDVLCFGNLMTLPGINVEGVGRLALPLLGQQHGEEDFGAMHTCIHAYMHRYIRAYMHTWVHACIQPCMHTYIRIHCVYLHNAV